jgi:acetylornithine deacetylase/succinyl-diaminopimelate desuccinylase-like protein
MPFKSAAQPLSPEQRGWVDAACRRFNLHRLKQLTYDLTAIHSPTGSERRAAEFLRDHLARVGLEARYQPITDCSGNCYGRIRGDGSGPTLMLYAPIDTHLDADPALDVPWVGRGLRPDMLPQARMEGDVVIGLGASNPKSMLATQVEIATCIAEAGVPLKGDLVVATAAGGMPWFVPARGHAGVSHGVMHLLSHGVAPDMAIILKPWDEVYFEHPGMCWFKVTTWGTLGYSGIPRGVPGFRSSIVPAAHVILAIEEWLAAYPERHTTMQVRPQGWIAAVRGGWPEKPAFPSAATEIYLDVRTNPDQTNAAVAAEFGTLMRAIRARHPDIELDWEMTVSCQASRTAPEHWIVQSCLRAWEDTHGRPHPDSTPMSGQTDAATICRLGIPLARVGYPWPPQAVRYPDLEEGLGGMGVAYLPDMHGPVRTGIYAVVDTCTRTRAEVALE